MNPDNQHFQGRRLPVPSEFEDIFTHFYAAQNYTDSSIKKTLFPHYQIMLIFNFGESMISLSDRDDNVKIGKCLLIGPVKKAFDYMLAAYTELFVINFKGDAFYRFFGQAMISGYIHPDMYVGESCFTELWKELKDISSATNRAEHIIQFCRPYLEKSDETIRKITDFDNNASEDPIQTVADKTNQSRRNVQLKHKKYLGYSAKEYARYNRFLKTISLLQQHIDSADQTVDWFEIIEQNGYYDQSHLIRDFNHFLSITPSQYITRQQEICVANSTGKT